MIKKNVIKEILVEEKQFEKNLESLIRETEEVKSKWLSGRKYFKNKHIPLWVYPRSEAHGQTWITYK